MEIADTAPASPPLRRTTQPAAGAMAIHIDVMAIIVWSMRDGERAQIRMMRARATVGSMAGIAIRLTSDRRETSRAASATSRETSRART